MVAARNAKAAKAATKDFTLIISLTGSVVSHKSPRRRGNFVLLAAHWELHDPGTASCEKTDGIQVM